MPTVTVVAAYSKRRRQDTLPLHPELVNMVREWANGMPRNEHLFPRFAHKKAWLMVKKDVERAGIPYRDENGLYADFHASGRHSYVTGLFKCGASITEARESARHTDVKMTMRYTHVGINDPATALAALRVPKLKSESPTNEANTLSATGRDGVAPAVDWQRASRLAAAFGVARWRRDGPSEYVPGSTKPRASSGF